MEFDPRVETLDAILDGALRMIQPRDGYRFSIDSILLANFANPSRRDRVLDLGAGCGVIGLVIAAGRRPREVVALEVQHELAEMARRNFRLNGLAGASVIAGDLCARKTAGAAAGSFDYIVANPPYRAARSGRESPNASRRIARGAAGATLREFVAAAARFARGNGRIAIVFTADRSAELLGELKAKAFEPKRIRFVYPSVDRPASTIMVEARKGGRAECRVEAPLVISEGPGVYTDEVRQILGKGASGELMA
jgi:tRNA1Val (adenine37-N6)-methyltransferase